MEKQIHHGRNVERFRKMLGIKQESLASELGNEWTQKKISLLEDKPIIDSDLLVQVAKALKVPVEAIESFDEQAAINVIGNTVTTVNDHATGQLFQFQPTINPLEEMLKLFEENKKLYERLLAAEREKNELLQSILNKK